jgi:hypothetical protein
MGVHRPTGSTDLRLFGVKKRQDLRASHSYVTGSVSEDLLLRNEFLAEENGSSEFSVGQGDRSWDR